MFKNVWDKFLTFLATKAGARAAMYISGLLAAGFVWLGDHVTWLKPMLTPENQLMLITFIYGVLISWFNWLTTNRQVKYGKVIQVFLGTMAEQLGIKAPVVDGVPVKDTAATAEQMTKIIEHPDVTVNAPKEVVREVVRQNPIPSARSPMPNGKG